MVETAADDGPSNFLEQFKAADGVDAAEEVVEAVDELSEQPPPVHGCRAGEQALPGSFEKPSCAECGQEDGPEGGGRYGGGNHEGLWYCGTCWKAWNDAEKADIMKPIYQQRGREQKSGDEHREEGSNFFDEYEGGEGTDDVEGAWQPGERAGARPGEMELPGSWDKPVCSECGKEEGDEGGGRYRLDENGYKFFCGRCWKSWDVDAQRRMMQAWAPTCIAEPHCPPPAASADPIVDCPPPDAPLCDDLDWGAGQNEEGDEFEEEEEDEGPWDDVEEASAAADAFDFPPALEPEAASEVALEADATLDETPEAEPISRQQEADDKVELPESSSHVATPSDSSTSGVYNRADGYSSGYHSTGWYGSREGQSGYRSDYGNGYGASPWDSSKSYGGGWGNGNGSGNWSGYGSGYSGSYSGGSSYGVGWSGYGIKSGDEGDRKEAEGSASAEGQQNRPYASAEGSWKREN